MRRCNPCICSSTVETSLWLMTTGGRRYFFCTDRVKLFVNRNIEHFFVQENDGVECLPLGSGGNILLNRQMGQEGFNLSFAHFSGMGFSAVVMDVTLDPIAIGLFRAIGIVVISQNLPHLIHEAKTGIRSEFFEFSILFNISDNRWKNQWKVFHILPLNISIDGKFSIL